MYHKCQKTYTSFLGLILLCIILITSWACDSLLPEKFSEKEFDAEAIDQQACFWFTDTTVIPNTIRTRVLSTVVDTAWTDLSWADSSDNKIIFAYYDHVIDSLQKQILIRDTLISIKYPANQKVSYALLDIASGETRDIYIYTSMEYTEDNINDYITVQLVNRDTSVVNASTDLAYETVSCCTDTLLIAEQVRIVPIIRARFKLHLAEDVYVVRFIVSRTEAIESFKITVLSI